MRRISSWVLALAVILSNLPQAFAVPLSGVGISTSNLLFYYDVANFNSYKADSTWYDLSGNGLNATLYNSPSYSRTTSGTYLNFAGSGTDNSASTAYNYAQVGSFNPSYSSGMTVSMYGTLGSTVEDWERIIDFGSGAQRSVFLFSRYGSNSQFFYESWNEGSGGNAGTSRGTCFTDANSVPTGSSADTTYYSITLTLTSAGVCQWYFNGVRMSNSQTVASNLLPVTPTTARTRNFIGRSNWDPDKYLKGRILRLALWNTWQDATTIANNHTSMSDVLWPTISGGSSSVNENTSSAGTIAADQTSTFTFAGAADDNKFNLDANTGALTFKNAPNYEVPDDANLDRTYVVGIRAQDLNGNYNDYVLNVSVNNIAEYSTLSLPSLSATPYKGIYLTITVTPSAGGTGGIVSYYAAGKRIPNCYKKTFSGTGNSTCSWKPPVQGFKEISATFTPSGSEYAASTSKKTFWIYKRATNR